MSRLFLVAYTCSGLAGLIYQVCWSRLLTLHIGHTTAAASAVVAAFLGGLAAGAAITARVAGRLTARQALVAYGVLELIVATLAVLLPLEIALLTPVLSWAYADGAAGLLFPTVRLIACLLMVFIPATALGATFPLAVRWFAGEPGHRARSGGMLYALNTAGAATGALLAGFVLMPRLGVSGTTWVGVAASVIAAACVALIVRRGVATDRPAATERRRPQLRRTIEASAGRADASWLAAFVLGVSGFAALLHEIAWTRVLTMVFGPTTYAFAATLAAVIIGIAIGSGIATMFVSRIRHPAFWLALVLAAAAAVGIYTSSLAGGPLPRFVAEQIARSPELFNELLWQGALLTSALILPTSALLGAAFPLALAMIDDASRSAAGQFGFVYAINSVGAVAGSLAAGLILIPLLGLETTLRVVALCLAIAAVLILSFASLPRHARVRGALASGGAVAVMFLSTPWDRELLASGVYLYAQFVPQDLELEPLLKAGRLLYYREGAAATVSVKRLTGTNTLAVDGKTDASNRGDMLTQKLVAHLPLLLHERPNDIAIIGLGSGVTVGSALTHPVERVDVIELSPEVVEASQIFVAENRNALADRRVTLHVADARSHLQLTKRQYDLIVSEPSNPWIAGVAALFTREFFMSARDRLAPGGLICQWANAYNISDGDLRSIVATFRSVFPDGTAWLVGGDDVVLIGSTGSVVDRLPHVERHWSRAGVAEDLARVGAVEPFTLWSLYVAGPDQLERYAAGAPILTDDRMTLEFSAPRELGSRRSGTNSAVLQALLVDDQAPEIIRRARTSARAADWRSRAEMMAKRDAFSDAYADYSRALALSVDDEHIVDGFVRTAILTKRTSDALSRLDDVSPRHGSSARLLVARSKLLAAANAHSEASDAARDALQRGGADAEAFAQLAAICSERGDRAQLEVVVQRMQSAMPSHVATAYYAAVAAFIRGDMEAALRLATDAVQRDATYAAAYDLLGAVYARLGDRQQARQSFEHSLTFDAHDSTAYANLGVLALDEGHVPLAIDYFAEALWLDAESALAREGLRRATRAY